MYRGLYIKYIYIYYFGMFNKNIGFMVGKNIFKQRIPKFELLKL